MNHRKDANNPVYEAEVIDSSVVDEGLFKKVLIQAGRSIALPALEAYEILMDISTPPQVKISMLAALTYLIMPVDLLPDFIPAAGFSDDLVALTAVISLWSNHLTPQIKERALSKLNQIFPL